MRLPIPWDRAGRERPLLRPAHGIVPGVWEAVAPYVDYEPVLAEPRWMNDDTPIDQAIKETAGELRASGIEIFDNDTLPLRRLT